MLLGPDLSLLSCGPSSKYTSKPLTFNLFQWNTDVHRLCDKYLFGIERGLTRHKLVSADNFTNLISYGVI